ncbi:TIGR02186 family protein [Amaricoccus solimangrovi]|uniref:TIGR02186 family protein n=1 Tax=Amaricoccus solimangrovi TaxID=2589815 RepID=A0A501WRK7_9RHOB|nr:TIGR02186 family protein [Amaricoccus solimangrovi]TPE49917.1 hypothetical protein FJM51_13210 [Amaricoccus solimangrovi]
MTLARLLLALWLAGLAGQGAAARESVVTGLSTDRIALTARYEGSEILVFGAIRRDAPTPPGMGPPDVIITLKGPPKSVIIRRKDRRLGIWLNTEAVRVRGAPSYYAIASTRPLDAGLLTETERLRHQIGMDQAARRVEGVAGLTDTSRFTEALARIREDRGLYSEQDEGVDLAQETLFQARFELPANLVEGDYDAEFFLVRDRRVISSAHTVITVEKEGIERWLYNLARQEPLLYGLLAVALALVCGWLANAAFARGRR